MPKSPPTTPPLPGWVHSQHGDGSWVCIWCQESCGDAAVIPTRCPHCGASEAPGQAPHYAARCTCLPGVYAEGCPVGIERGNHATVPPVGLGGVRSFRGKFAFLSNFWPVVDRVRYAPDIAVLYDGVIYPTSEHAFAAAKTLDLHGRAWVGAADGPARAKQRGRQVPLRPDWEAVKASIMYAVCLDKFTRNPDLRRSLQATGELPLVEGNTWGDTYWGVCQGQGHNVLGQVLMAIRGMLARTATQPLDGVWATGDPRRVSTILPSVESSPSAFVRQRAPVIDDSPPF